VLEVQKDVKFEDLIRELQTKYGKYLIVTYEVMPLFASSIIPLLPFLPMIQQTGIHEFRYNE
jgi:hypothetical protein